MHFSQLLYDLTLNVAARQSEAAQRMAFAALGGDVATVPRRHFFERPADTGAYVLPVRQSFVKDARLSPGARCMLALLAGWAGTGRPVDTTQGAIGRHLRRSVRQVYRYLQDAAREGYLRYAYTKNRLGMITGLRIYLNFDLIRGKVGGRREKGRKPGRTHGADTNTQVKDSICDVPSGASVAAPIAACSGDAEIAARLEALGRLVVERNASGGRGPEPAD